MLSLLSTTFILVYFAFQILNIVCVKCLNIEWYIVMACYLIYFKLELIFFPCNLNNPYFMTLTHQWLYPQNSELIILLLLRVSLLRFCFPTEKALSFPNSDSLLITFLINCEAKFGRDHSFSSIQKASRSTFPKSTFPFCPRVLQFITYRLEIIHMHIAFMNYSCSVSFVRSEEEGFW